MTRRHSSSRCTASSVAGTTGGARVPVHHRATGAQSQHVGVFAHRPGQDVYRCGGDPQLYAVVSDGHRGVPGADPAAGAPADARLLSSGRHRCRRDHRAHRPHATGVAARTVAHPPGVFPDTAGDGERPPPRCLSLAARGVRDRGRGAPSARPLRLLRGGQRGGARHIRALSHRRPERHPRQQRGHHSAGAAEFAHCAARRVAERRDGTGAAGAAWADARAAAAIVWTGRLLSAGARAGAIVSVAGGAAALFRAAGSAPTARGRYALPTDRRPQVRAGAVPRRRAVSGARPAGVPHVSGRETGR
eukprot:ctg_754.g444